MIWLSFFWCKAAVPGQGCLHEDEKGNLRSQQAHARWLTSSAAMSFYCFTFFKVVCLFLWLGESFQNTYFLFLVTHIKHHKEGGPQGLPRSRKWEHPKDWTCARMERIFQVLVFYYLNLCFELANTCEYVFCNESSTGIARRRCSEPEELQCLLWHTGATCFLTNFVFMICLLCLFGFLFCYVCWVLCFVCLLGCWVGFVFLFGASDQTKDCDQQVLVNNSRHKSGPQKHACFGLRFMCDNFVVQSCLWKLCLFIFVTAQR